jgi:hypothetical protein
MLTCATSTTRESSEEPATNRDKRSSNITPGNIASLGGNFKDVDPVVKMSGREAKSLLDVSLLQLRIFEE